MSVSRVEYGGTAIPPSKTLGFPERFDRFARRLPRPLRFLGVGGIGLTTDLAVFTAALAFVPQPLLARIISLACATIVTWRLNRAFTFDRSGRRQHEEAVRYAAVTAVSQGVSYAVFAAFVLTVLAFLPQAALLAGAAAGAVIGYNGHRLFAFRPRRLAPLPSTAGRDRS